MIPIVNMAADATNTADITMVTDTREATIGTVEVAMDAWLIGWDNGVFILGASVLGVDQL